ncbi:hypothetical protein [Tychonema sp. LEGE 07203]|uniref:hypothetical protein n=1 Tax=Tychonema sp. LEGE 07203 TaxID=1828671 RepID=UPI0018830AF1|nr:hypothetical protein [Tychonema sp. LEGE 07203]MBE9096294.1 hypothetical protein [Tychonema sp. LEGE 07203]
MYESCIALGTGCGKPRYIFLAARVQKHDCEAGMLMIFANLYGYSILIESSWQSSSCDRPIESNADWVHYSF